MKRRLFIGAGLLIILLSISVLLSNCGNVESVTAPTNPNLYGPGAIDTTPPTVTSVNPTDSEINVGTGQIITAVFSEPISEYTVTTFPYTYNATFDVTSGGTPVPGYGYVANQNMAVFVPLIPLSPLTTYNVALTTGITDQSGNALTANYTWSFTTGNAPDTTAPYVISVAPTNGATNVPVNQVLSALFSEQIATTTVDSSSFLLSGPSGTVAASSIIYNSTTVKAYFTPSALLASNTTYTATLTTGITDLASPPNTLAATYIWSFTTAPAPSIATPALPAATETGAYTATLTYSGGVSPYTWSATGLPAGLSIGSSTGIISGTTNTTGTFSVTVTVQDSQTLSASHVFSLTVNPVPSITSPSSGSLYVTTEGNVFTVPVLATGGTGTMSWTAKNLPSGINGPSPGLNGNISGTVSDTAADPNGSAIYTVGLKVTDSNAVSSPTVTITITVLEPVDGITLTQGAPASGNIIVSWPTTSTIAATDYKIYYDTSSPVTSAATFTTITSPYPATSASKILSLSTGTSYYINVSAIYSAGTSSLLFSAETSTTAP